MLVRVVHISVGEKTVASSLTCLNTVYILLFLLFALPNCGSCHQRCVCIRVDPLRYFLQRPVVTDALGSSVPV